MPHADDENHELFADRLVDDAVATYPQPAEASELTLERGPGEGLRREPVDGVGEASAIRGVDASQRPGGASLDPDRVGRA